MATNTPSNPVAAGVIPGASMRGSFASQFPAKLDTNLSESLARHEFDSAMRILNMQLQKAMSKRVAAKGRVARELTKHMSQLDAFKLDLHAAGHDFSCQLALQKIAHISSQIHHHLKHDDALAHGEHEDEHGVHLTPELHKQVDALPIIQELGLQRSMLLSLLSDTHRMQREATDVQRALVDFGLAVTLAKGAPQDTKIVEDMVLREAALEAGEIAAKEGIDPTPLFSKCWRERMDKIRADAKKMATGTREAISEVYVERVVPKLTKWRSDLANFRESTVKAMRTKAGNEASVLEVLKETEYAQAGMDALAGAVESVVSQAGMQPPAPPEQIVKTVEALSDISNQVTQEVQLALTTKAKLLSAENARLTQLQEDIKRAAQGHAESIQNVTQLLGAQRLNEVLGQLSNVQETMTPHEQSVFLTTWIKESIGMVSDTALAIGKELGTAPGHSSDTVYKV